jgi:hypothetical protein
MAATPVNSVENIQSAISKDGFFFAQDPVLGQRIQQMDDDAVPFASAGGLQFCKTTTLDNQVS